VYVCMYVRILRIDDHMVVRYQINILGLFFYSLLKLLTAKRTCLFLLTNVMISITTTIAAI